MEKSYTERLSRYIIVLLTLTLVCIGCWFLRNILMYIILAILVSQLSRPVFNFFLGIKIKKWQCPDWLASFMSLLLIFIVITAIITTVIPLVREVARDISNADIDEVTRYLSAPLSSFNHWVSSSIPQVGNDFRIETFAANQLVSLFDASVMSDVVGSVTGFMVSLVVLVFAVISISFFLIKTPSLLPRCVSVLAPDKYREKVKTTLKEIDKLVSRYFVGMAIEVLGVSLLNFFGLLLFAGMGFKYSLGIAFMTGILNVIPYVGPIIGVVLGTSISVVIRYTGTAALGLTVGFGPFVLILLGIFLFTQIIDAYVFQPLIYSNSVKVHPLEIFLVFLIAGELGGILGMFLAVPAYTVIRVIAKQFWGDNKVVNAITSLGSE